MAKLVSKAASGILKDCANEEIDETRILAIIDSQIKGGNLPESGKTCPECNRKLSLLQVPGQQLECCIYCKSLWFDGGELKAMTGLYKDIPADNLAHRKSKYNCPVCGQLMREYLFMPRQNLLVDKCPDEHGIYLQSGELKRVFDIRNAK